MIEFLNECDIIIFMKTVKIKSIKISEKDLKELNKLYKDFYKIYGNENTVWDIDDLNSMMQIGQEFMEVFFVNYNGNKKK